MIYLIGFGPQSTPFQDYSQTPCDYTFSYDSTLSDNSLLPDWIDFDWDDTTSANSWTYDTSDTALAKDYTVQLEGSLAGGTYKNTDHTWVLRAVDPAVYCLPDVLTLESSFEGFNYIMKSDGTSTPITNQPTVS